MIQVTTIKKIKQMDKTNKTLVSCAFDAIGQQERIMGNKLFDPATGIIYTDCGTPIGKNVKGKVKWFKKSKTGNI